jgi:hypothetical protein
MAAREPYEVRPPEPWQRADRATRFIARVDAHLPTLCDDAARRAFLDRQLEGWEHRYARFLATEGASEFATDTHDPPHAAEFLLTITALAARRIALGGRPICRRARDGGDA